MALCGQKPCEHSVPSTQNARTRERNVQFLETVAMQVYIRCTSSKSYLIGMRVASIDKHLVFKRYQLKLHTMIAIIPIALYIVFEMNYDRKMDKYKRRLSRQK